MIDEAIAAGRAAYPDVELADEAFRTFVSGREPFDPARAADLWLACALARGDTRALEIFEAGPMRQVRAALVKTGNNPDSIDETLQNLRKQLLAGDAPGIAAYAGRGDLVAWLRVTGVRELIRVAARASREKPLDSSALDRLADGASDPELDVLRRTYGESFAAAVRDAIVGLDKRQRALLRSSVVEGLSIDEIGAIYRVHRATAARWLVDARDALARSTRALLGERLKVSESELASIARLVESQLDVSVARLLAT